MHAFSLLNSIYSHITIETLLPYLGTILNLLLMRLQESVKESKVTRYSKLFLHSLCVFCIAFPPQTLVDQLENITNGLITMIVLNVLAPNRENCCSADKMDVRQLLIGGTRLLLQSAVTTKPEVWSSLLKTVVVLADVAQTGGGSTLLSEGFLPMDDDEVEGGRDFDSTYSKLAYASVPADDPSVSIVSPQGFFATSLSQFCAAHPGQYVPVIQAALDSKEAVVLQKLLVENNVGLV